MDRTEATFRLRGALRQLRERADQALAPARWHRSRLIAEMREVPGAPHWNAARTAMRSRNDSAAHQAFARHFAARTSAFPLNAREVPGLSTSIAAKFPLAAVDASRRADDIVAGSYDLLGHRHVRVAAPVDWHHDPVHDRRMPRGHWSAVRFLDPVFGDHKVVWELNRHQHWLALGRAFALTGERKYYDAFRGQLIGWMAENPPLTGVNWASMLELGFRILSWQWALSFFAAAAQQDDPSDPPWLVDMLLGTIEQQTHVERNLSLYFSPNTHLTGEVLALYVTGCSLPELASSARWRDAGREVLLREASAQICSDGGHAERSGHYHRYSTDFYLLALAVARRYGDVAAEGFEETARAQAAYLRTIADDTGYRPSIGDDDGGQLFPICGRPAEDCSDTLSIAATLLNEPDLAVGLAPEEAFWMCGETAGGFMSVRPVPWPSRALAASGYYVSRTPAGDHLIFDAGPHGFLNGGHAHADALSVLLTVKGRPLFVDPGTATYTMDSARRDAFRSTPMHNTLVVDHRPQSEPRGPFHWRSQASAQAHGWWSTDGCDFVIGAHDAYDPVRHVRSVLAIHGVGWWILDRVSGDTEHDIALHWHLHPSWRPETCDGSVELRHQDGAVVSLATSLPVRVVAPGQGPLAMWSPAYGRVEAAPVLIAECRARLPLTIATFISASPASDLTLEAVDMAHEPAECPGCAWRARWSDGRITLLAPHATQTSSLLERWGTAHLQTDGTLAALVEANGRREVVLVNGTTVCCGGTPLLELGEFTRIVRAPVSSTLASSMHQYATDEVGTR
jgi:hypothetical protein